MGLNENVVIELTGPRSAKGATQYPLIKEAVVTVGEIGTKFTTMQEEVQFATKGGVIALKG